MLGPCAWAVGEPTLDRLPDGRWSVSGEVGKRCDCEFLSIRGTSPDIPAGIPLDVDTQGNRGCSGWSGNVGSVTAVFEAPPRSEVTIESTHRGLGGGNVRSVLWTLGLPAI